MHFNHSSLTQETIVQSLPSRRASQIDQVQPTAEFTVDIDEDDQSDDDPEFTQQQVRCHSFRKQSVNGAMQLEELFAKQRELEGLKEQLRQLEVRL